MTNRETVALFNKSKKPSLNAPSHRTLPRPPRADFPNPVAGACPSWEACLHALEMASCAGTAKALGVSHVPDPRHLSGMIESTANGPSGEEGTIASETGTAVYAWAL